MLVIDTPTIITAATVLIGCLTIWLSLPPKTPAKKPFEVKYDLTPQDVYLESGSLSMEDICSLETFNEESFMIVKGGYELRIPRSLVETITQCLEFEGFSGDNCFLNYDIYKKNVKGNVVTLDNTCNMYFVLSNGDSKWMGGWA